jgi:hypothetical protein
MTRSPMCWAVWSRSSEPTQPPRMPDTMGRVGPVASSTLPPSSSPRAVRRTAGPRLPYLGALRNSQLRRLPTGITTRPTTGHPGPLCGATVGGDFSE